MSPGLNAQRTNQTAAAPAAPSKPTLSPRTATVANPASAEARRQVVLGILLTPLIALNIYAASYYLASPGERVRNEWHRLLRPSGVVGQSAGILAFAIFIFLWLYPMRKKWKKLAFTGSVAKWLDVHVTSALLLPLLLATHAAWRSDGVIGLGLVAMMVVIASGVVGRYLYTRIPRAKSGVELDRDEVAGARQDLLQRLADTTGRPADELERLLQVDAGASTRGIIGALRAMVLNDFTRARRVKDLRVKFAAHVAGQRSLTGRALDEAVALADREIALTQQARMLEATHKVFKFWHVAHRPFAVTALVAVTIHIAVVVALHATWFW